MVVLMNRFQRQKDIIEGREKTWDVGANREIYILYIYIFNKY